MKKNVLFMCLVLLLTVLVLLPTRANAEETAGGTCGKNLTWSLEEDGTLTISGTGAMSDYYYDAPWYAYRSQITNIVVNEGVTSIGCYAFRGCSSLTAITIPDSVTSIGDDAFYSCSSLTAITIPDGVTSIGHCAFDSCRSLTAITIPDSVTRIGYSAFEYCRSLITITIGDSVTSIGDYTFCWCDSLTAITIGDSVASIGDFAFSDCSSLTSITIPESVTSIGNYAFSDCSSLTHVAYTGTQSQWSAISIGSYNSELKGATRHYETRFEIVDNCEEFSVYCPHCQDYILQTVKEGGNHSYAATFTWDADYTSCAAKVICTRGCGLEQTLPCVITVDVSDPNTVLYIATVELNGQTFTDSVCAEYPMITFLDWDGTKLSERAYYWGEDVVAPADPTRAADELYTYAFMGWDRPLTPCNGNATYRAQYAISGFTGAYCKLTEDTCVQAALTQDLYLDLNGFDMTGTIVTNGYHIYGMDTTTNAYTCDQMGYFRCVDGNGAAVVPQRHVKTDSAMTGAIRRYLTIETENGYTFHRFYLSITHTSIRTATTGIGYKGVFYGDDMVKEQLAEDGAFGFTVQLAGGKTLTCTKPVSELISGKTYSICINHYDVARFADAQLSAGICLLLEDGTVISSSLTTVTFRGMMEQIDLYFARYCVPQLQALKAMIDANPVMKDWKIENIYTYADAQEPENPDGDPLA